MVDTKARGELIAWLRRHTTSHADLAAQVGVTAGAVAHWVHGRQTPGLASAAALERVTHGCVRAVDWVDDRGAELEALLRVVSVIDSP